MPNRPKNCCDWTYFHRFGKPVDDVIFVEHAVQQYVAPINSAERTNRRHHAGSKRQ